MSVYFKLPLTLILLTLITACSPLTIDASTNNLFSEYQKYNSLFNNKNNYSQSQLEIIFSSFSPRKQKEILNGKRETNELLRALNRDYLSFPLWLEKIENHYEINSKDDACLLLNGYNKDNERLAINIKYVKLENWKMDQVHVEFLAPFNRFLSEPICDKARLDEIRFKEMM